MDAICDEKVMKFISENLDIGKEMANGYFFTNLRKTVSIFMDFIRKFKKKLRIQRSMIFLH